MGKTFRRDSGFRPKKKGRTFVKDYNPKKKRGHDARQYNNEAQ